MSEQTAEQLLQIADQYRRAGREAEACHILGIALRTQGRMNESIAAYRRAISLRPDFAEAHYDLANALRDSGQLTPAIGEFRQAIAIRPAYAEAHGNLGNILRGMGRFDEALAASRQARLLDPHSALACNNLGNILQSLGQLDEAMAAYRQALVLDPHDARAHSSLICTLLLHPQATAESIAAEQRRWDLQHAAPLKRLIAPHANNRDPDRQLRIGYVSADFFDHPVSHFMMPLLSRHDRGQFEILAYSQSRLADAMTGQVRAHIDGWRDIAGLDDQRTAELIRRDRIDILIDLAGHTANNRLLVFAQKPAPVQMTYLGYPNSTGLETMDYRMTDIYADPPADAATSPGETLVRLDPCGWCYQSPPVPAIADRKPGPITFGCFNNIAKVNDALLQLWGRILLARPPSRLMLKGLALGSLSVRERMQRTFADMGIDAARVELLPYEPDRATHLACYPRVDIALDTFPYHGTMTTCEALWMGVPVISLAGQTHVSRVGVSLLSNVGLRELIAQDRDEYVNLAVALANDPERLKQLRDGLRDRMKQSSLLDAVRFAGNVESAYRRAWRGWCASASK